jgi:hypothetical protein
MTYLDQNAQKKTLHFTVIFSFESKRLWKYLHVEDNIIALVKYIAKVKAVFHSQ